MSTRKIIRNGMRRTAELRGYRASAYVRNMWDAFQVNVLGGGENGRKKRLINKAKGSRRKKNWRTNIQSLLEQ